MLTDVIRMSKMLIFPLADECPIVHLPGMKIPAEKTQLGAGNPAQYAGLQEQVAESTGPFAHAPELTFLPQHDAEISQRVRLCVRHGIQSSVRLSVSVSCWQCRLTSSDADA